MKIPRRPVRYVWITTTILWLLLSKLVQADIEEYLTRTQMDLNKRDDTHANRLMRDLFVNYNKDVRPVFNYSDTVNITMHLWFKQVLKVDEIDQILTIYCWTEEFWNDQFLRWYPQDYGGLTVIHLPIDKVWRPDILVYNNADMNVRENELSTNAVLNYTGGVLLFRAVITKITCNLDMTYFPFDKQVCSMMFASWSYDGGKVTIKPKGTKNNLEYYIENTEWKLENFGFKANEKYYDCCPEPYYDVTYSFVLERNPSYYILNLIIPSVFITIVTMVGFFTPYSSTGENTEKVSLGVTALLSLAIILLMVADKMPATSKVIPLIGKYYIGLIWLIFAATIVTTVTLRVQSKGNAGRPLNERTKRFMFDYVAKFLLMRIDLPAKTNEEHDQHGQRHSQSSVCKGGRKVCQHIIQNRVNGGLEYRDTCNHVENADMPSTLLLMRNQHRSASTYGGLKERSVRVSSSSDDSPDCCLPGPVGSSLRRIIVTLDRIDDNLERQHRQTNIEKDWEQLARVIERILMILFIFGTVLFALYMLQSTEHQLLNIE